MGGRKDNNFELTLATFDIDSYCSYTESYKVKFDYGTLDAEAHQFDSAGGQMIYLGLTVTSDGFDFADNMTDKASSGKAFAPQSCEVSDEHNTTYTLFAWDDDSCNNDAVDFSIEYDNAKT